MVFKKKVKYITKSLSYTSGEKRVVLSV